MVSVTALYASLLAILFIVLSARVIAGRRLQKVALGVEGNPELLRRARVQGNFAEYVPLALVLMALAELQGTAPWLIHGIGTALFAGRLVHAFGVSRTPEDYRFRVTGMTLTFGAIAVAAVTNLARAITQL